MNKPSFYAIIPASVRYDDTLCPNAKLLYGEITALCNKEGRCWAGNAYFANLYGVSKVSISKWVRQLVDAGFIQSEIQYAEGSKEILNRYITLINEVEKIIKLPLVCVGGGGNLNHYSELFSETNCDSVGSSSIFHFTQFTPLDIKKTLSSIGKPVRI